MTYLALRVLLLAILLALPLLTILVAGRRRRRRRRRVVFFVAILLPAIPPLYYSESWSARCSQECEAANLAPHANRTHTTATQKNSSWPARGGVFSSHMHETCSKASAYAYIDSVCAAYICMHTCGSGLRKQSKIHTLSVNSELQFRLQCCQCAWRVPVQTFRLTHFDLVAVMDQQLRSNRFIQIDWSLHQYQ